jgi:hypothetical protein
MNLQLIQLLEPLKAKLRVVITSQAERIAIDKHIAEGAPGLQEYLQSERSNKAFRALIDDYLEFLKTGR